MPHGVLTSPCGNLQRVQPFDNLPRGPWFLDQPAKHVSHHLSLFWMDVDPRREPEMFGDIAVAIRPVRPRQTFGLPRFVQPAATRPVGNLAPCVFGHHPLHLGQQLAVRSIPKGMLHENDTASIFRQLFQEQPLMRITAG
jgi:hypothetical protein